MKRGDYFFDYTEEDLRYELDMLIGCQSGLSRYPDPSFLRNLCLEGLLLHAKRIIEIFHLKDLDNKKWEKRRGLISEHLSHANPSNRKDPRSEKRKNPEWDVKEYYYELIDAVEIVAYQHKSEFPHYELLINILESAKK